MSRRDRRDFQPCDGVLDNRELLLHFAKVLGPGATPFGDLLLGQGDGGKS